MAERVMRYWQPIIYILSLAVGVGITVSNIRNSEARIADLAARFRKIEEGSPIAREAVKHAEELERRLRIMEEREASSRVMLERIDERVRNILNTLDRLHDGAPSKPARDRQ
jgi:hypothetical protein